MFTIKLNDVLSCDANNFSACYKIFSPEGIEYCGESGSVGTRLKEHRSSLRGTGTFANGAAPNKRYYPIEEKDWYAEVIPANKEDRIKLEEDIHVQYSNLVSSAGHGFENSVVVTVISSGEVKHISTEEYSNNKDLYKTSSTGKVTVRNNSTGETSQIDIEDFNKDLFEHVASNTVSVKTKSTKSTCEYKRVSTEEFENNNHLYDTATTGFVSVIVKSTNESKQVTSEEYKQNKDLYTRGISGKVPVKVKATGEKTLVSSEEYRNNKNLYEYTATSPKVECEHCSKIIASHNYKRWHGDNCKKKK